MAEVQVQQEDDKKRIKEKGLEGWEANWQEGRIMWDKGTSPEILLRLLQNKQLPPGRALVPGCGSGYDVITFAKSGYQAVGLDGAPSAIKKAEQLRQDAGLTADQAQFELADFFTYKPDAPFDVIFDYTFFCAIQPEQRPAWAAKQASLLSASGTLITLIYPIGTHEGGPPFAVHPDHYEAVLKPVGLECVTLSDVDCSHAGREGKEKLGLWRKQSQSTL
eukprot:jgi/Chlat1/5050/Chrsp33S05052